jgi:hypothetical protein
MGAAVSSGPVLEILALVVLLALAAATLLAVASVLRSRADVDRRLRVIEERVGTIASHLGLPEPGHEEVAALVDDGRLVEAVSVHRRRTGASLLEAKKFVDDLGQQRRGDG